MARKGIIYKLLCDGGYWYAGSTDDLNERVQEHQRSLNRSRVLHYKLYQHINQTGGWDNVVVVHVKDIMYDTEEELRTEEQKYIKLDDPLCMNQRRAFTSYEEKMERQKEYIQENIDSVRVKRTAYNLKIRERRLAYKEEHKKEISTKGKEYRERNKEDLTKLIECECGSSHQYRLKAKHLKTEKHLSYLSSK